MELSVKGVIQNVLSTSGVMTSFLSTEGRVSASGCSIIGTIDSSSKSAIGNIFAICLYTGRIDDNECSANGRIDSNDCSVIGIL
tara:strand:- start:1123 stop:1374 length:252 start_codon:yes stop_codon:yes gene_type:complete